MLCTRAVAAHMCMACERLTVDVVHLSPSSGEHTAANRHFMIMLCLHGDVFEVMLGNELLLVADV